MCAQAARVDGDAGSTQTATATGRWLPGTSGETRKRSSGKVTGAIEAARASLVADGLSLTKSKANKLETSLRQQMGFAAITASDNSEQLSRAVDKSEDMRARSQDFASAARQLREHHEARESRLSTLTGASAVSSGWTRLTSGERVEAPD